MWGRLNCDLDENQDSEREPQPNSCPSWFGSALPPMTVTQEQIGIEWVLVCLCRSVAFAMGLLDKASLHVLFAQGKAHDGVTFRIHQQVGARASALNI